MQIFAVRITLLDGLPPLSENPGYAPGACVCVCVLGGGGGGGVRTLIGLPNHLYTLSLDKIQFNRSLLPDTPCLSTISTSKYCSGWCSIWEWYT